MSGSEPTRPRPWADLGAEVTVLAPDAPGQGLAGFLDATRAAGGTPFAAERREVIHALSAAFLADPVLRRDAASVAVAYWMRRAQIERLAAEFERRVQAEPAVVRVPVGRVFHVAPANVDTLFIYSWALAFLCSNANVVRLSQERTPVVEAMLDAIRAVARDHAVLGAGDRFVTYAHDAAATEAISAWCSHRVIWGGSETVAALRPLALNPHASERVFGNKFSYSVFAAARFLAAGADERARIASGFFNDLFWFDQMACSSPHLLFWVGSEAEIEPAIGAFEADLQAEADRRGFAPSAASAVQRRAFAFELAADTDVRVGLAHPGFVGIHVREAGGLARETCGGGLLRHYRLDRLDDLAGFAEEGDQTVTHFGFGADELRELARRAGARGVDRVVPVGEALAFDVVWDGFDLLDDFTRRVRVKSE
jgi:hypothetical protein